MMKILTRTVWACGTREESLWSAVTTVTLSIFRLCIVGQHPAVHLNLFRLVDHDTVAAPAV